MAFLMAIFISFVLYGLSNSLFSSVWPQIAIDIVADYTLLGILMMILNASSGITSAFAYAVRRKLGTSRSVSLGFALYVIALVLIFGAKNIISIGVALAIMGAANGIIDTVSNSYVIKAYDAGKVSLLHASWGLGAAIGPAIMSFAIIKTGTYKNGFIWTIVIMVVAIVVFLLMKMYWEGKKKVLPEEFVKLHSVSKEEKDSETNLLDIFKIKNGVIFVLCFVMCGSINTVLNGWVATLAVSQRGLSITEGATAATCFFIGMTVTRLICGLIAKKISNQRVIYFGLFTLLVSFILLFVRMNNPYFMYVVSILLGVGVAPLLPFIHGSVKDIFDEEYMGIVVSCCNSTSLIGGAIVTALMTVTAKLIGINNVQVLLIIVAIIGLVLFTKVIKNKNRG